MTKRSFANIDLTNRFSKPVRSVEILPVTNFVHLFRYLAASFDYDDVGYEFKINDYEG